jgi:hypothetical protein
LAPRCQGAGRDGGTSAVGRSQTENGITSKTYASPVTRLLTEMKSS